MGSAIGGSLALAVGIAVSPVPIVAVVLILTSRRARVSGLAFIAGWLVGLGVIGAIVLAAAGPASTGESAAPAAWTGWLKLALGVLLLADAAAEFRRRPRGDQEPALPSWMATVDRISPVAAAGLAAALAGINPKNLLLAVGGATQIAQTGIPAGQQIIAYAVFAVIASLGVGLPVGVYFALGHRSQAILAGLKDWMARHNAVIVSVLCLIIAAKLIGDAIAVLT